MQAAPDPLCVSSEAEPQTASGSRVRNARFFHGHMPVGRNHLRRTADRRLLVSSGYVDNLNRLRELPVSIVHGGHLQSFGGTRSPRGHPPGGSTVLLCGGKALANVIAELRAMNRLSRRSAPAKSDWLSDEERWNTSCSSLSTVSPWVPSTA